MEIRCTCKADWGKPERTCSDFMVCTQFADLKAALDAILAEPHGCVFCDSGKLRNPEKDHDPTCGFAMARAIRGAR